MQRISIVGSSGSGKTTLARTVAERLDLPHLELDSVYHQADWQPMPDDELRVAVEPLVAQDGWVIDGNYTRTGIQDLIWNRADTIVWLDLGRMTTMRRVTRRSISRSISGVELWNCNKESWTNLFHPDPEINIITWTWTRYAEVKDRYERASIDPRWDAKDWLRLHSQRDIDGFVAALTPLATPL